MTAPASATRQPQPARVGDPDVSITPAERVMYRAYDSFLDLLARDKRMALDLAVDLLERAEAAAAAGKKKPKVF